MGWNTFDWSAPAKPILTDPPGPITNEDILEVRVVSSSLLYVSRLGCLFEIN